MSKFLSVPLLALLLLLPLAAAALEPGRHALAEAAGVIQELDLAGETLVIDGMRYDVATDVDVEIGGSFGAFTMLSPGMRVYFEFLRVSESNRVVTLIRELPAEVELDQV